MPPKKAAKADEDLGLMRAARFGRVKNDLSMGFVGLPNVGKSTITNLLAGAMHAEAANYPFCTIDPNVVRCIVPDQKFQYLAKCYGPPSIVPAALKVTDIAGLIRGASEGAGLGNAFLSHIAAVDGIFHLVRAFESDEVIHVDDSVDAIRDLETIQSELCLKDKDTLSKVVALEKERVRKEKGLPKNTEPPLTDAFLSAYSKCEKLLEANTPIQTHNDFTAMEVEIIRDFSLITTKPQVYIINMSQKNFIRKGNKWLPKIADWVKEHGGGQIIPMSAEFEQNVYDLKDMPDAQQAFLDECTAEAEKLGLKGPKFVCKSVVPRIIRSGRASLCLQSFYTAGPKEVRSWTIQQGCLAPQAAGVIHSDFERGFIKAEVANFDDFKTLHAGAASMAKVKEAGKYRQEGKTYAMQDGDIVVFMHNVTASKKK
uniref:Obg-like ATPase homolog n=1 Tax=Proboscia inermis TaxID=420281 RepID=A0A7S0BX89_9STRA|eukprot:CAMPEP_0171293502 /NCGR_PEP_ID=MMETSP0816-20121228/1774_1 /TAXON_ID=420281 /ORGANISM="Proboscia inermis, Strain CCAP1064/1" /LENGTH=426 /DNA_ID=CAMNT_0011764425 /DNA_START=7 /DNA_END=1287 /DNA_ORIENTATION=+